MTADRCQFVRDLRVDSAGQIGGTWRDVAQACAIAWEGDWGSNQLWGMAICEIAAAAFGENYKEAPWN